MTERNKQCLTSSFIIHRSSFPSRSRRGQQLGQLGDAVVGLDSPLLQTVAIADRHAAVLQRLAVDRDAVRRADLVLPGITATDGAPFVVEDVESLLQVA